jgi:hypothetical protein
MQKPDWARRNERLEVASRIAAGLLAQHVRPEDADDREGYTIAPVYRGAFISNLKYGSDAPDLISDALEIADGLIAAVDAVPGKPASEVEFKPEGGAS